MFSGTKPFLQLQQKRGFGVLTSLSAASALHTAWKYKQHLDSNVFTYIKHEIRSHPAEHLSAMIYFSGLLKVTDSELWNLYEMQVTRTDVVKSMSLTSVFKSFEGFARWSTSEFEAFDMLEMSLDRRVLSEPCTADTLCDGLYILASLNRKKAFPKVLEKLSANKEGLNKEQIVKVLWSLAVAASKPAHLKEWLEFFNEHSGPIDTHSSRVLVWTLECIKFNK